MQEFTFQVFEAFTAATVIYIIINIVVTFGMRWVERRAAVPGFIGAAPAASDALRRSMFADFDFDVIIRSLPYLFYDGMTFTLMLTALATVRRHHFRHAARDDAAVGRCSRSRCSPPAT